MVKLHQCSLPTGIGDADQRILGVKVYSSDNTTTLTQIAMKMTGTSDISDVSAVKLYYTADSSRFFIGGGSTLLDSENSSAAAISLSCNQALLADTNYFWIVYDVSPSAIEGHQLDAVVDSVVVSGSTILMNICNSCYCLFNTSADFGMTWGIAYTETEITDPNCNGDILRYTCVNDGYLQNRILHSIPFASNCSNVSVLISYDDRNIWPVRKTIYSGASAYSSLCVLPDGTIGLYYEVGEYEIYQMYFVRFSLDWLTDGADHFSPVGIDDNGTEQGSLQLFPNPSDGIINIVAVDEFSDSMLELTNAEGKLIFRGRASEMAGNARQRQLDLSGYPAGLYFVHLTDNAHAEMIKVVRQ